MAWVSATFRLSDGHHTAVPVFIRPSAERCLGSFHFFFFFWLLWTVPLWKFICKFLCGHSLRFSWAGASGHVVTVCLTLGGTVRLFSKGTAPLHTPLAHILPALVFWRCESGHPGAREAGSHCGFDLLFPADWWCWASFPVLTGHVFFFFEERSIQILCPCFNFIFCLFIIGLQAFFPYSRSNSLIRRVICKHFLPLWELPSYFLDDVIHSTQVLNLMSSCLSNYFFLFHLCLWLS